VIQQPGGDVHIVDLGGRGPLASASANGAAANGGGSAADNLLSALLQYPANAPIIDQLLGQAGFAGSNPVEAVMSAVKTAPATNVIPSVTEPKPTTSDNWLEMSDPEGCPIGRLSFFGVFLQESVAQQAAIGGCETSAL